MAAAVIPSDPPRNPRQIHDPIHGYITIEPEICAIIDTPQFQRLRELKQLGSCYEVFPGASHARFEHSIGVMHLAGVWLEHIQKHQKDELQLKDREILLVKIAALCHDLGHGPFSHAFDNDFLAAKKGKTWNHELGSQMMFEDLYTSNPKVKTALGLAASEIKLIKDYINPDKDEKKRVGYPNRLWLYEIVANPYCSVDVDKWDYILRDSFNIGHKSTFDYKRLVNASRVIGNRICFDEKEVFAVYELFHTRYSLTKQVYQHRVVKAIEYMIVDILDAAEPYLKCTEAITDPKKYIHLTDSVIRRISCLQSSQIAPMDSTTRDGVLKAQALINRIYNRDLYKMALEFTTSKEMYDDVEKQTTLRNQFAKDCDIPASEIIVKAGKFDYAMKDKNPVDHCLGWRWPSTSVAVPFNSIEVSGLVPGKYVDYYIRIFLRHPSPKKVAAIRANPTVYLPPPKSPGGTPLRALNRTASTMRTSPNAAPGGGGGVEVKAEEKSISTPAGGSAVPNVSAKKRHADASPTGDAPGDATVLTQPPVHSATDQRHSIASPPHPSQKRVKTQTNQ